MKIVEPSVVVLFPKTKVVADEMLLVIEEATRTCYKSEDKMGTKPNIDFILDKININHLSVLEHSLFTVKIVCDRGVSHELVRHRIASYSQESTRYCNYSKDKFGKELTFVKPCFWAEDNFAYKAWLNHCDNTERLYMLLRDCSNSPEEIRSILPNSLKTEIVMSANLREWRHFFELRLSKKAHPQMREVAKLILIEAKKLFVGIFDDLFIKED